MQNEELLRRLAVRQNGVLATSIGSRRAILPSASLGSIGALDRLWVFGDFACVTLPPLSIETVEFQRETRVNISTVTLSAAGEPTSAEVREYTGKEYYVFADSVLAPGAPVIFEDRLVGMVLQHDRTDYARVLPIHRMLAHVEFALLDPKAQEVMRHAEGIRLQYKIDAVHIGHLLLAVASLDSLWAFGRKVEYERLRPLVEGEATGSFKRSESLAKMPAVSKHVRAVLDAASHPAAELTKTEDLVAAALNLRQCGAIEKLYEHFAIAAPPLPPPAPIAGYSSDAPSADSDPFDVRKHAHALCSVLAATEVTPPVSVGLFAPWGAGKTSFMKAMSRRFDELTRTARANPGSVFCSDIVQIWFNAWHYAEQNLLASLADAVFEGLDAALVLPNAEPETVDADMLSRRELEQQQKLLADAAAVAQKKVDAAQQKNAALDHEIETIKKDDRTVEASFTLDEALIETARIVSNEKSSHEYAAKAAEALKLPPAEAKALMEDVRGFWSAMRALLQSKQWLRTGWLWFLASLVIAGLPFVWPVLKVVALAPLIAVIMPVFKAVRALNEARQRAAAAVEEKRTALLDKRAAEKAAAEAEERAAREELQKTEQKQAVNLEKIAGLSARQSMADWVRERRTSATYARQLGVAAEAHRDFRRLTALLKKVVDEKGDPDSSTKKIRRIDRIVLYIDDLDRCTEEKVVEVLQAVHLLLAFELFVVIVAVDSKWLLHSLQGYSKAFADDGAWRSTPREYLEKIIQIPFSLEPMDPTGYGNFIEALTKPPTRKPGGQAILPVREERPVHKEEAKSDATTGQAGLPVLQETDEAPALAKKETVDPRPEQLIFTANETEFMKTLHPLMTSPRSAKRFVNIYRLMRATMTATQLEQLIDPSRKAYEPLLLLVAYITNHPEEAEQEFVRWNENVPPRLQALAAGRPVADFHPWLPTVSRYLIRTTQNS
jgi:hypothetical protein